MRLLCGSCARLPRLGPGPFVTKPLLASLFSATTPGCLHSLHPIVSPRCKAVRFCLPLPAPTAVFPAVLIRALAALVAVAARPAAHTRRCPSRSSYKVATSSPRLHAATRRCPPRSSRLHLGHTSLPAPQLVASSSTSAPRLRVNARPAAHSSPRTHLAARPAACSLPPSLRLNVAACPAACAKPLPHVAARRAAALHAAAHPAAHSHFRHLGCTSLPAPQLTAKPRLLVAACPAAHSFTSAQLSAPCSLRCVCLLPRSPLQLAIRVFGAAQLPAPRSLPSDVSSAQLRAPCSLPCMLCQLSFPPLAAFSFGGSSTVGSLGAFSAACPV